MFVKDFIWVFDSFETMEVAGGVAGSEESFRVFEFGGFGSFRFLKVKTSTNKSRQKIGRLWVILGGRGDGSFHQMLGSQICIFK